MLMDCSPSALACSGFSRFFEAMRPKLVPELICSDLQVSLAFYTGLLGFHVVYGRPDERFAFLEREGVEIMLEQPLAQDRLWPSAELVYPFGRGINLQIEVADIDALHAAVSAAGTPFHLVLEDMWYRRDVDEVGNRQFAIQDPDGYLLRLFQSLGSRPRTGSR